MKTWLAVLLAIWADALGNVALARGMRRAGTAPARQPLAMLAWCWGIGRNPMLGLGVLAMAVAFGAWLALLSWAELSFALPATAPGYALNLLGARYLLQERVTTARWLGTLLIGLGVALIALEPHGR
jgi:drug/metabolite transporter (DMT)-like permease